MTKFNLEVKKKFVELIESNKYSIHMAFQELGISRSVAKRWWKRYEIHGLEGLSMKSGTYTGEFKLYVVKYMHENHLSVNEATAIFGIPGDATLLKWKRIYYEEGESGLFTNNRGRTCKDDMTKDGKVKLDANSHIGETEEELELEVKRLRAESCLLKKLIALKEEKKSLQTRKNQW
ncbi:helix-turn-helix domain-containing protein [Tissierella praeacuta]|uniref:helix-turn-helix domain-containing protein n=1 Tax=Tissierella praeacuta TaxID=43131 RepID=UPI001C104162|nr:helix-turn-helix domain-containing protein [Tissierella praeacuta]MBU5254597.1 transposase [Tissierella praeacuta]